GMGVPVPYFPRIHVLFCKHAPRVQQDVRLVDLELDLRSIIAHSHLEAAPKVHRRSKVGQLGVGVAEYERTLSKICSVPVENPPCQPERVQLLARRQRHERALDKRTIIRHNKRQLGQLARLVKCDTKNELLVPVRHVAQELESAETNRA